MVDLAMTPEQKIKHAILLQVAEWTKVPVAVEVTSDNVDHLYSEADENYLWDAMSEVRSSGVETGLPCPSSRHYESDAVAAQMPDGSWVGWTYWYGGGKHGEPEAVDWMDEAYDLSVTEEERVVTVRTFAKVEAS
jgi:hypothetical protein